MLSNILVEFNPRASPKALSRVLHLKLALQVEESFPPGETKMSLSLAHLRNNEHNRTLAKILDENIFFWIASGEVRTR